MKNSETTGVDCISNEMIESGIFEIMLYKEYLTVFLAQTME